MPSDAVDGYIIAAVVLAQQMQHALELELQRLEEDSPRYVAVKTAWTALQQTKDYLNLVFQYDPHYRAHGSEHELRAWDNKLRAKVLSGEITFEQAVHELSRRLLKHAEEEKQKNADTKEE